MYLSRFEYNIEHIDGGANIFADILTMWLDGYRVRQKGARTAVLAFSEIPQMTPSSDSKKIVLPSQNIFRISKDQQSDSRPQKAILNEALRLCQIAENFDSYGRCGRTAERPCRFSLRNNGTQGRRSHQ